MWKDQCAAIVARKTKYWWPEKSLTLQSWALLFNIVDVNAGLEPETVVVKIQLSGYPCTTNGIPTSTMLPKRGVHNQVGETLGWSLVIQIKNHPGGVEGKPPVWTGVEQWGLQVRQRTFFAIQTERLLLQQFYQLPFMEHRSV